MLAFRNRFSFKAPLHWLPFSDWKALSRFNAVYKSEPSFTLNSDSGPAFHTVRKQLLGKSTNIMTTNCIWGVTTEGLSSIETNGEEAQ